MGWKYIVNSIKGKIETTFLIIWKKHSCCNILEISLSEQITKTNENIIGSFNNGES